jgi:hypothetical protein
MGFYNSSESVNNKIANRKRDSKNFIWTAQVDWKFKYSSMRSYFREVKANPSDPWAWSKARLGAGLAFECFPYMRENAL